MKTGKWFSGKTGPASVALAILCFLMISCGADEPQVNTDKYADWATYSSTHFNLHFSRQSSWLERQAELGQGYDRFLKELCSILEFPMPKETIDLYVYTPGPETIEMLGDQKIPFSTENSIHWGGLYPYGYQLTKFLLGQNGIKPGDFEVLNEGVPHLLDFSGLNYHDKANRLNNSGQLTRLLDLGDNVKLDSLHFSTRRAEAASLCGFIMFNYGTPRLYMLWKSSVDWQKSIETIFQLPIDEFETNWLDFARGQCADPDGTVENDTIEDMRVIRK
ncbi:MAG: hypothetical protein GY841_03595 [FCB group bacterium]|nr:hypothetical protein [FCB group bacterium]